MADRKKILIVEDHATIRLLFRRILERRPDVEVQATSTGELAETIVASENIALIIMDYHLPRQDGVETVKHIRATEAGKDVPIIMITGGDAVEFEKKSLDAGAVAFFRKPIDHDGLMSVVRRTLGDSSEPPTPGFDTTHTVP